MYAVVGMFHVAAAMLVVGGVVKLRTPGSVRPLARVLVDRLDGEFPALERLLSHPQAGRFLGAAEVLLGAACLVGGRIATFAAAVFYVLLADLQVTARSRGVYRCPFLISTSTSLTVPLVLTNLAAGVVSFWAGLANGPTSLWGVVDGRPLPAVLHLLAVGSVTAVIGWAFRSPSARRHGVWDVPGI